MKSDEKDRYNALLAMANWGKPEENSALNKLTGGGLLADEIRRSEAVPAYQPFSRPTANGLYFNGKVVTLDGFHWVGCRFDNCVLAVSSSNFDLVDCVIDSSTTLRYGSEPIKVIQLFNCKNESAYAHWPKFAPIKNADGSITINGVA